ncbi:MAG: hypothetical protein QGG09_06020, partial [Pirellulaceae bacterium]|nr:hypothetical protein [Pirellulaceae bacterium]
DRSAVVIGKVGPFYVSMMLFIGSICIGLLTPTDAHAGSNPQSLSSTTVAHYECWIGDPLVLK